MEDVIENEQIETNLYVVYDKVAEKSGPVAEAPNHQTIVRQLRSVPEIMANVMDFDVLHVGHRCRDGSIFSVEPTQVTGLSVVKKEKKGA